MMLCSNIFLPVRKNGYTPDLREFLPLSVARVPEWHRGAEKRKQVEIHATPRSERGKWCLHAGKSVLQQHPST